MSTLVILSGGQDSTTCLYWAIHNISGHVHAITFDYNQRHRLEIDSAKKIAQMAGVLTHEIVELPVGILKSMSPLVADTELEQYEDQESMDKIIGDRRELTFVPMRNALFLTIAANRAEELETSSIVIGVAKQDGTNYSDCTEQFIYDAQSYINEALGHEIMDNKRYKKIYTPLMELTKRQTVQLARTLPGCWEALAWSHTSYAGEYPPRDKNHANILRATGFEQAGFPDPLVERAWREGLMELPETENYDILRRLGREV